MKLLGHAWVAVNVVPKGNKKLLILGSILPEIAFYTKNHPFEYEEIHEGGIEVYQYLKEIKPDWVDLGLGMMTHSYKLGVDKFNDDENLALLGFQNSKLKRLRKRLEAIFGSTAEAAKNSTHNILELAVELKIAEDNPQFVSQLNKAIADKTSRAEIKKILASCFQKPHQSVSQCVDELMEKAKPDYFKSAEGLAKLWIELTSEFKWKPNEKQLAELLNELSKNFSGKDEEFLRRCIEWTRGNIEKASTNKERK